MSSADDSDRSSTLEHARARYDARAWTEAYDAFSSLDGAVPLGPSDLALFATTAYMLGRVKEMLATQERVYRGYLDEGEPEACHEPHVGDHEGEGHRRGQGERARRRTRRPARSSGSSIGHAATGALGIVRGFGCSARHHSRRRWSERTRAVANLEDRRASAKTSPAAGPPGRRN